MMRIALLNLPWSLQGRLGVRAGSRWPFTSCPGKDGALHYIPFPFFLAYSSSLLKKNKYEVKLIDAIAQGADTAKVIETLLSFNPELIVIETSTPSFLSDISSIKIIHNQFPHCQIALCGPHASVFHTHILGEYDFITYILVGEYEYTLLELADHLRNNLGIESVLGLAYRAGAKTVINNPRPTIDNLDDLPWPDREGLPIYSYNDGFCGLPTPNVQIWASRGCAFRCIFCLWPQTIYREHKYRKRSPLDVVNEMEYLLNKFNFRAVYFDDDTFNMEKEYALEICRQIRERKIKVTWAAMARADLMDENLLNSLASSGLYAVKYGIESADENVLNLCRKDMDLGRAKEMIKITKVLGIKVHLTFCLGLPGETKETIKKTTDFLGDTDYDSLQFSFAVPFPGTEYFKRLETAGSLLSKHWPDYDGNRSYIINNPSFANEYLERIRIAFSNNNNL